MGGHVTGAFTKKGKNAPSSVPFGETIAKISEIHDGITSLRNKDDGSIEYEKKIEELETYLLNAYKELAGSATEKIENWKEGPIIKKRHISEDDLKL